MHCIAMLPSLFFTTILCLLQNRGVSRVLPKPENLRSVQIFQKHPASCLSSVFRQLYVPVLFRTTPHLGWQLSLSTVHVEWQILRIVILETVSLLSRRLPSSCYFQPGISMCCTSEHWRLITNWILWFKILTQPPYVSYYRFIVWFPC